MLASVAVISLLTSPAGRPDTFAVSNTSRNRLRRLICGGPTLYARERLRVIDMPQAVDARTNPSARLLLARDVANVCRHFASQGADAEPGTFASELWDLYGRSYESSARAKPPEGRFG